MTDPEGHWQALAEAITFAGSCIAEDPDPLSDVEQADGREYILRILQAVAETSTFALDFDRPSFLTMRESVRHLGAAGPDIDYDVAVLLPGERYRIAGHRGGAAYVGIVVYGAGDAGGASAILDSVDVDGIAGESGEFIFDVDHPEAFRVIIRQYFHDRAAQERGRWEIARHGQPDGDAQPIADPAIVAHRIRNGAETIRWNAQLNRLWTPERRAHPNEFIRLGADEIVAAIPNPDVTYSFTWWQLGDDEALVIDCEPPRARYWAIQLCDRWFQSYPQRQTNLNNRQVRLQPDGSFRCVVAGQRPDGANWLDSGGHRTGVVFFRWLHAEPGRQPVCRVVKTDELTDGAGV